MDVGLGEAQASSARRVVRPCASSARRISRPGTTEAELLPAGGSTALSFNRSVTQPQAPARLKHVLTRQQTSPAEYVPQTRASGTASGADQAPLSVQNRARKAVSAQWLGSRNQQQPAAVEPDLPGGMGSEASDGSAGSSSSSGRSEVAPAAQELAMCAEAHPPSSLPRNTAQQPRSLSASPAAAGRLLRRAPAASPARPSSGRLRLEDRVANQMMRSMHVWTVTEVADYVEWLGLGAYRRSFVHNGVCGAVMVQLTDQSIKDDVGIRNLGHRHALLLAIADTARQTNTRSPASDSSSASDGESPEQLGLLDVVPSTGSSRAASPTRLPEVQVLKVHEQRAKLMHDLEKAESKAAKQRLLADEAVKVADAAAEEVQRLHARIEQLDEQLGGKVPQFEPFDQQGRVAWLPTGSKTRSSSRDGVAPGSPMSAISRKIMNGQQATFLERVDADISARRSKIEAVHSATSPASQNRFQRDLDFLQDLVSDKSSELQGMLASGDNSQMQQAVIDIADVYGAEYGLTVDQVESIRHAGSPAKKAAKLTGFVRSGRFMARLEEDLVRREDKLRELQHRYFRLDAGRTAEGQDKHDLHEAAQHFTLLGWSKAELEAASGSSEVDNCLEALLKRAEAVQLSKQGGKAPDDDQLRHDGLDELQEKRHNELRRAAEEQQLSPHVEQGGTPAQDAKQPASPGIRLPAPQCHLQETVNMLAGIPPSDLSTLHTASGTRKLLLVWRAVRSQQFVASMAAKEEERRRRQQALEQELYPSPTKRLPKEQLDNFFDRLTTDALRRQSNKDALADAAKAEALAKLTGTKPGVAAAKLARLRGQQA